MESLSLAYPWCGGGGRAATCSGSSWTWFISPRSTFSIIPLWPVVAMQGPCLFFVRKIPGLVLCQPRNSAYLSAGKPLDSTRARTQEQFFQRLCWAAEPIQAGFPLGSDTF